MRAARPGLDTLVNNFLQVDATQAEHIYVYLYDVEGGLPTRQLARRTRTDLLRFANAIARVCTPPVGAPDESAIRLRLRKEVRPPGGVTKAMVHAYRLGFSAARHPVRRT